MSKPGWYDSQSGTLPALLTQDAFTLIAVIPVLLISSWLAHRGSLRGLLVWMGMLFYTAYSYYFYVVGIRLSPLFPIHIGLVSVSMCALLALWFALDQDRLKDRFKSNTPVRLIGGFLMVLAVAFATLWTVLSATHLSKGMDLDPVSRYVIAIDGVVLLPLLFFGGLWLWRRWPMGYALAGVLLPKIFFTLLTLILSTAATLEWGLLTDPVETLMYSAALTCAALLLGRYLKCVEPFETQDKQGFIDKFIERADVAESQEILVNAPLDITFDVARKKLVSLRADRFRDIGGGKAVLTPWTAWCARYEEFSAFRVPTSVEVAWDLETGPFVYARFHVTNLEYNVAL